MKINKVIIGNKDEAFIENRFKSNINIISSDDNNKGKTLVIQSMMYALGNNPIFPSSFEYKNYYHIIEFEINNSEEVIICRKKNSFTIIYKENLYSFDTLSEFKYFINKTLFPLPTILKDGINKLVDPELLYEIFFVGQDNRNTSKLVSNGYYNKKDFINMLYNYVGIDNRGYLNNSEIKNELRKLKNIKRDLEKQNKILKSVDPVSTIINMSSDRLKVENTISRINELKNQIFALNSMRNNAYTRKIKNETTLKELRSLNRSLSAGKMICLNCGSDKIGYTSEDNSHTFDISTTDIRNQIIASIEEKIEVYNDQIDSSTKQLNQIQKELQILLTDDEIKIESLLLHKSDFIDSFEADEKLIKINDQIKQLKNSLKDDEKTSSEIKEKQIIFKNEIVKKMNKFYKMIDPQGNLVFDDLFSTKDSIYSGSEETEFYFSKLIALYSIIEHEFPIIIDCFRAGELSSIKEEKVMEILSKIKNQIILTVTLKNEELGKYDDISNINHINYMSYQQCKLLTSENLKEFYKEIKKLSILKID